MIRRLAISVALCIVVHDAHAQPQPDAPPPDAPPAEPQPPPPPEPPPAPVVPPGADPAVMLRDANAAATAGDWARVSAFTQPLLARQLDRADLTEAHRLAGLAAYFEHRERDAETQFLEYLKLDLDGRLDPALYPPEVVNFFDEVRAKHATELRALRPKPKRYFLLNFVPVAAQLQNGDRGKAIVFGGLLATFAITNVTTYLVLRSWCTTVTDPVSGLSSVTCDDNGNHVRAATTLRALNGVAGVALIVTYVWGVYDGVSTYRRRSQARSFSPYVSPSGEGVVIGVGGGF